MHETGIALELHRMCRTRIGGPEGRIDRVSVVVGERSAVDPELLRFAWEAVVAGTRDAGAVLDVEWRPIRPTCTSCGPVRVTVSGWLLPCPACGAPLRLEGGDELDLLEFSWLAPEPVPQEAP